MRFQAAAECSGEDLVKIPYPALREKVSLFRFSNHDSIVNTCFILARNLSVPQIRFALCTAYPGQKASASFGIGEGKNPFRVEVVDPNLPRHRLVPQGAQQRAKRFPGRLCSLRHSRRWFRASTA